MELNKPNPFNPNKNQVAQDWKVWKREFLIYLKLSGCYEKCTEEERALILLNLMGTEGVRAMEKMTFDHPNEKDDMDILIMKFDQIFDPPLNEAEERYKFFSRKLRANENIDDYIKDLKNRASTCNFGSQSEKFIIDVVIYNLDSYLRDMILAIEDVSLIQIVQYHKQFIINNNKIKELTKSAVSSNCKTLQDAKSKNNAEAKSVHNDKIKEQIKNNVSSSNSKTSKDTENENNAEAKSLQPKFCWKCNTKHLLGGINCPAYGNICNICNQKNHFNGVCVKQTKDKQKEEIKRICSKCGTNHLYKQCPAYDNLCRKCFRKGHYVQYCKEQKPADKINKITNTVKSTDNMQKLSKAKLEYCLWCELKHVQNECPHPANCANCDAFPHKICFNCRKNPHDVNCYFKNTLILPAKTLTNVNHNTGKYNESSSYNPMSYCNKCKSPGHLAATCEFEFMDDALLKEYVKVENEKSWQDSAYCEKTMPTNSTYNANYLNNTTNTNYNKSSSTSSTSNPNFVNINRANPTAPQIRTPRKNSYKPKSDFKKRNEKPDACTIA